ncbi:hypothetical protein HMPREF1141_0446 [Clostridium sp. MSTE9]|nr:hypothetical protein HMPREF1141_0446 [Clostridium sp. MSTE9]
MKENLNGSLWILNRTEYFQQANKQKNSATENNRKRKGGISIKDLKWIMKLCGGDFG